jgi:ssDNA-binding Zn-finger/Zn-ribbon topoisomerase 1
MKLRMATKGVNAGRQFYGCSKYPNCRGTRDYSTSSKASKSSSAAKKTKAVSGSNQAKSPAIAPGGGRVVAMAAPRVIDPASRSLIEKAVGRWIASLVDFSRNNNLLFYKETKTTTLDLKFADPILLGKLFAGESVSFLELFTRPASLSEEEEAFKKQLPARIKKIRSKAQGSTFSFGP